MEIWRGDGDDKGLVRNGKSHQRKGGEKNMKLSSSTKR